jgi:hypothetical protein
VEVIDPVAILTDLPELWKANQIWQARGMTQNDKLHLAIMVDEYLEMLAVCRENEDGQ